MSMSTSDAEYYRGAILVLARRYLAAKPLLPNLMGDEFPESAPEWAVIAAALCYGSPKPEVGEAAIRRMLGLTEAEAIAKIKEEVANG